jgi:zinc transport system substrate-binding protein
MVALLILAVVAPGCGGDGGRTTVAASFLPLAEVAKAVGGDHVDVIDLTPPGAEPHGLLQLSPPLVRVRAAAVLVYVGHGFQPAVDDLARTFEGRSVDLLRGLPIVGDDPHLWLDPAYFAVMVTGVQRVLSAADPGRRKTYAANASRYRARLATLDGEVDAGLADCDRNVVVTAHAAWRYFTSRYGLEQEPVAGVSPDTAPEPGRLEALANLVRDAGVTTVFVEPLVADGPVAALARDTGVRTQLLDPVEGTSGGSGATYFGLMRRNLAALRTGLGCR